MIIDLILDRYNGDAYDPKEFYDAVMDYEEGTEYPISRALDDGEEEDVKRALCDYIDGEYNPNIKKFINAVEWLTGDDGKDYSKEIDIMAEKKESTGKKDEMKVTPEVAALFVKGEDGHSQIYNGLCNVCEGTTAHVLQYEEAQEPSRWVSANLVFDESGYEVLVYDYGENEISYSIKDEYGNNLKDYISAARGAPLGKQKGYTPDNIDDMWIALEDDLGKLESDSENESKNESDFGAFDWTVTVSYIDKETGDKVSDVFLIKAHNMPSAKEQAILRANRKGTDAKVDSCRMGDYVSNESKTSEASRKWRADPADRGVGGKWGPVGTIGFVMDKETRKDSSSAWKDALDRDEPFADDKFRAMLEDALNDMALSWDGNPDFVPYLAFRPYASIRGYDANNPSDAVVQASVILEPECPNESVANRFSKIINSKIGNGGLGFAYSIIASEEECTPQNSPADKVEWRVAVDIQMTNAGLLDWLTEPNGINISRKDAVSGVIGNMDDGISEVISLWKRISKETTRKFGKQESKSMNKSSMQKKIESLSKKNETGGDELPYGFMQYRDDDTNEWLPVLVSVNENPRGWYYDGLAPTDNLGGFGYEEYSRGFLKTCKPGTGKCDPKLVKAMKTFYIDSANKDGLKPIEVDDLTAYIPKGKVYIGKE